MDPPCANRSVPHAATNLTRAREAFVYSIRRRSLRFAQLTGVDAAQAQPCLQHALAEFLPPSRRLPPAQWSGCWWGLLLAQTRRIAAAATFSVELDGAAWKRCWNALPSEQRAIFLLRVWLGMDAEAAAQAMDRDCAESERQLAIASLQLRTAMAAAFDDSQWLDRLRDAFEHAELIAAPARARAAEPAFTRPRLALPQDRRRWLQGATLVTLSLMFGAIYLWRERTEPLPRDLSLPDAALGLRASDRRAQVLPEDVAMLLDPDWPLWAEPDDAVVIDDLAFYTWLQSVDGE